MPKKLKEKNSDRQDLTPLEQLRLQTLNNGKWEKVKTIDGEEGYELTRREGGVVATLNLAKTKLTFFTSDSVRKSRAITSVVIEGEELARIILRIKGVVKLM
jgi:hypothetical protein